MSKKRKHLRPQMSSLEAAMHMFSGPEFPRHEHWRDHIMTIVLAAENNEVECDRASETIKALVACHEEAFAAELEATDEGYPEGSENDVTFSEAERLYINAYTAAYNEGLERPADEETDSAMWPDFLPQTTFWPKALIVDIARLLGYKDARDTKAFYKYVAEHKEELNEALAEGPLNPKKL